MDREEGTSTRYAGSKRERSEEDSIGKRTSWVRRLSTVTPSLDGSFGSPSLNRPSTPSVFSNGSNAPLFSTPTPVTPRNKLVKRSTSQRMLHSGSPSTSPFPARNTTFRRPATSYQRSEHLRLQSAQQNLGLTEQTSQTFRRPLYDLEDSDGNSGVAAPSSQQWHPFFRYRRKKISPDAPQRRASFSRILGGSDYIYCIESQPGVRPLLVNGRSVQKPQMHPSKTFDSPLRVLDESGSEPETEPTKGASARPEKKGRNSFSIGDFMPSSAPSTWKGSRNGSLKLKKGRGSTAIGRRTVSAPQGDGSGSKKVKGGASRESDDKSIQRPSESRDPSSPLPPLEQLSAFEIELPGTSSSNHTSGIGEDPGFASYRDSPLTNFSSNHTGSLSTRLRTNHNRGSRVPSDYSTTFGSDNEHSRVFSMDGEEAELRSETAYDSLRTDASGSSHSGARSHRVDTVFGDQTPPDSLKQNPVIFQEKLSRIPVMSYRRPEDFIAEEDSVKTPTRREGSSETEGSTIILPVNQTSSSNVPISSGLATDSARSYDLSVSSQEDTKQTSASREPNTDIMPDIVEDDWDQELGIETEAPISPLRQETLKPLATLGPLSSHPVDLPERPKSNIFEWSERQAPEKASESGSSLRPRTAHPQQGVDRGGRPQARRLTGGVHLRSQSVPLPPENSKHRFNSSAKLDSWKLGSKGESEKWDNDFEFDEPPSSTQGAAEEVTTSDNMVIVPKEILERQASVHGQFGQVKELSLLVEELRRLHHSASVHGILSGQSSGLWKEAEGIIDLATLDEDEPPQSPNSTSFDFDGFDEDPSALATRQRRSSSARSRKESQTQDTSPTTQAVSSSTPVGSRQGTPKNRPRQESVARAKNVLETINQHRSPPEPSIEPVDEYTPSGSPSKKMPFDTTSLRDLVVRAGVVTRALKEIIRKAEDPEYVPRTPERRSQSPPDPPFVSHIFHNSPHSSPSPSNDRKNSPVAEKTGGALTFSSLQSHDNEARSPRHGHGHPHMMTVV